ncbi:hypothetical protein GCM10010965_21850 [Caldalkalibacillus thermarum]|uniref:hypothetical protein n=1 Tax=Caldalkalibacillus thermarum TaxID=296745 RepID=UPI0016647CDE|nr:hypothetical protein [Caldalkalibacillus thermarum]GGK28648.1 hypothetical protein GCM10010965_21850 [Caldalkalibacillus thermarum]
MLRKKCILTFAMFVIALTLSGFSLNKAAAEEFNVSPMIIEDKNKNNKDIGTLGTVVGSAGESWVYLNRVSTLRSQASFGARSFVGTMVNVTWTLTYSDGNRKSGTNFPMSTVWTNTHYQSHSRSGIITVTLSGTAITSDGKVLVLLNPTDAAYIY